MKYIANVRIRKQDRNGNTYHDVQLLDMDGNELAKATKEYGYGHQYKQTTADMINKLEGNNNTEYSNVSDIVIFIDNTY